VVILGILQIPDQYGWLRALATLMFVAGWGIAGGIKDWLLYKCKEEH
jgi:hypothetical protein